MWAALVLACVSALSLSASLVASEGKGSPALSPALDSIVMKSASRREISRSSLNTMSERMTTLSPVTLARGTLGANHSSPVVTAGRTHRTDVGAPAAVAGGPNLTAPGVPATPSPTPTWPTPSSTAALGSPHTQAPRSGTSPRAAPLTPLAPSTRTAAAPSASAGSALGTQSPAQRTPGHSTASPTPLVGSQAQDAFTLGPATPASTAQPAADTASRPTPPLANTTPESTPTSVASVSTTVVTATKAQAEGSAASTVPAPVPHTSWTPGVELLSPTTPPSPAPSPQGPADLGMSPTPEPVQPEVAGGAASTGPTPESSGDPKTPTTDSCQLSTQGQYLVVTTNPLPLSLVNRSALLAALLLGVTLFVMVLVLFALQAYESYKKKDYTQVDYLINGMYADSEM